jgi:2-oxoglutarate ferredoxin oxidoreductase subunit beta
VSLALGAEATFVARTIDTDKQHLPMVLRAAAEHDGAALVEIYQNCNVFNDGAFDAVRRRGERERNQIRLEHGAPVRFGADGERGVVRRPDGSLAIVDVAEAGEDALVVHDAHAENPAQAFALAQVAAAPVGPTPIGVFRGVERPVYAEALTSELEQRRAETAEEDLDRLLKAGHTWTVEERAP